MEDSSATYHANLFQLPTLKTNLDPMRRLTSTGCRSSLQNGMTAAIPAALLLALCGGCGSPLDARPDTELRRAVLAASQREIQPALERSSLLTTARVSKIDSLGIRPEIVADLERASGPESYAGTTLRMSPSLLGQTQQVVQINLRRAVLTSTENNLTVQFARIQPAIEQAKIVAAESAFDWTLFNNSTWNNLDRQAANTGAALTTQQTDLQNSIGLRRRVTSGGQFAIQQAIGLSDYKLRNNAIRPDPTGTAELTVQFDQPLLRNFGSEVNLAEVRLAENAERDQIQVLKANLLKTATDTEEAYWNLCSAVQQLRIAQRLVDRGIQVRDVLRSRSAAAGDVRQAQLSDAIAQVASREADVVRAEAAVRAASDRLKSQMNDRDLPIGSDVLVLPADMPVDQAIEYSVADSLVLGLQNRPEIQRAILGLDDASVRQMVADNGRLPQLDMRTQIRMSGLSTDVGRAAGREVTGSFVDYIVGLSFEIPIGNRGPEATYRVRKLERSQAAIAYRDVIQRVTSEVITALRQVTSNYALIEQTRAARIAAAENLRALEVEEKTIQALTPEFLDLKLRRQAALAGVEIQEFNALSDYNIAIARLHAACGTTLERNQIKFTVPTGPEGADRRPDQDPSFKAGK